MKKLFYTGISSQLLLGSLLSVFLLKKMLPYKTSDVIKMKMKETKGFSNGETSQNPD